MSVHWNIPYVEGTNKKVTTHRTIKHSRAYCHCPDGKCESGFQTPPKREVKNKKLEGRLQWFNTQKPKSNYRKPGSNK